MLDFVERLKADLLEQYRGKPNIDALEEAIGKQFNDLLEFFEQLEVQRNVYKAQGEQLDGIGDIVALSRAEASKLIFEPESEVAISDDEYRQCLIYKILKNTCQGTYYEIIEAFRMFWDKPLYYKEDHTQPATMIFDTGELDSSVDTTPLFKTPFIKPAGVTVKLYAKTTESIESPSIKLFSGLGYASTQTELPMIERNIDFGAKVYANNGFYNIVEDAFA